MSDNEGEANIGMMDVEGDAYEEVFVPEQQIEFYNDEDRAEYVLQELKMWAQYGVSTKKIKQLLKILGPLYPNLPKSYKTLLETLRHTKIYQAAGGEIWYKGVKKNISQRVSAEYLRERNEIVIDLSMDGLPPFKHSDVDCWPKIGCLDGQKEPFIVAVFIGKDKPNDINEFLHDLVNELRVLQQNGINIYGIVYPFRVRHYICDAPARPLVKCTVGHYSKNGCERCTVRSVKRVKVLTFNDFNEVRRMDESFANREHTNHHAGVSPLEDLGTQMVSQFVYDGLHLLHEGVFKRWLDFVLGTKKTRIRRSGVVGGAVRQLMSNTIIQLAPYIPTDFNRRPRPLHYRAKYRATEMRRLFLYDGLLVLQHLPGNFYRNYQLLHAASFFLSSPELYLEMNDVANFLVQEFITHAGRMFGEHFIAFYIHCFHHFPEECARLGPVESFSAYKYENYLGVIKRLLRSKYNPLQQIANRDTERGGKLCEPQENDDHEVKLFLGHDPLNEEVEGDQFYGVKSGKLHLRLVK
ncbi:hypothetical protein FOCC_FOCC011005 [Frankliniella occidentalis]|nr:hypothetical protein FOCC_FOCC011005 [Frankliniella occidentalis]